MSLGYCCAEGKQERKDGGGKIGFLSPPPEQCEMKYFLSSPQTSATNYQLLPLYWHETMDSENRIAQ